MPVLVGKLEGRVGVPPYRAKEPGGSTILQAGKGAGKWETDRPYASYASMEPLSE